MKGNTNMSEVCEMCERGKEYKEPHSKKVCLKCFAGSKCYDHLRGMEMPVVYLKNENEDDIATWIEVFCYGEDQ